MEPISNPNSKALVVFNPVIAASREKSRTTSSRKVSSPAKVSNQKSMQRSTRTSSRLAASVKSPESNPYPANQSPNPMRKRPKESDAPQFSEIRSKRRHQAFSQQPYHPDFIDANSKKRFDELFATKEFLVEQPFTIDSHSVFEILQLNQLENCVSFGGNYNKSAVAEFYANIGPAVTDTKSPTYQKVFVRGVWVNFSPTDINQLLGSPMELSDFSSELERPNISPDEMVQTLTKNKFQVWPENSSLFPASHLSTQFSLLHKLSKSQWIPSSHLSDISQREAMFLYLLASKTENLNIGCVIYENILERANPNKQRKLVHPVLITKLLKQQSVPFRPSDVVLDVPAPLGSNKRLHTGNRVNDLPSSSASGAETRQFYPAHLTAELRAAVSDAQKCLLRLSSILDEVSKHENEKDPAFEVHMFWDLEHTRVRPNQVSGLVKNIEASLQTVDTRYYLADKKVAVGSSNLDFFLEDEGFYLVDAPKPQRGCQTCGETCQPSGNLTKPYQRTEGVAQRKVLQEMTKHVLQNGLSRNILLVSGSSDFKSLSDGLKSRGYNVFLAVPKDSEERYKKCGTYVWDWDMMKDRAAETIWRNP